MAKENYRRYCLVLDVNIQEFHISYTLH